MKKGIKKKLVPLTLAAAMVMSLVMTGGCTAKTSEAANTSSAASATSSGKYYSGTINIAMPTWIGFAPLYIAQENGYFKKNGVDVKLSIIESAADRRTAYVAKSIQGQVTCIPAQVMSEAAGLDLVQVVTTDESYGGDGIVAKNDIKSLKDLSGKTVAFETSGSASCFYFYYIMSQAGLDVSKMNITIQDMSAGNAGAAFAAGKLDSAVTWEPWLTNAKKTSFGHVLRDTTQDAGVLTETISLDGNIVRNYPDSVQGIVNSWYDAIDYIKSNHDDAVKIMAKDLKMSVSDVEANMTTVKYYGETENVAYFGSADKHGKMYDIVKSASDLWKSQKLIETQPALDKVISTAFVVKKEK